MKKIQVAIIGTGYIADYHARGLKALANVEITTAIDTDIEAAKKFASTYQIKNVGTDAMSIAARENIDAVLLCIPNKYHAPYAIEFLKNGKNVFLEKPMAMNSGEGKEITDVAAAHNQLVMVGHMWRFDTEVNHIKKKIEAGVLGNIIKTKGYGIHENWGPSGWFTQKELAGGGALADMGVHAIDTVRYLLGDPKPLSVFAKIGTHYGDYDVDDSGIIVISWDTGTTSIIESGWWNPHMDGPEAATRLYGTMGYASVFPTFLKYKGEETTEAFKAPGPVKSEHCDQMIYDAQMEYFIRCITTRDQPSPGLSEGQVVLNIVDAAYLSSRTNKVITLD